MLSHLLFMRHAKSSWANGNVPDHARPLNPRGRDEADLTAQTLVAKGFAPDLIWASDARRTTETAERLIHIIPGAQTIIKAPEFYNASAAHVLAECARADEPEGRLMLLGHNPGWSELLGHFMGRPHAMPTACCAVFARNTTADKDESGGDWLSPVSWRLVDLLEPKDLKART